MDKDRGYSSTSDPQVSTKSTELDTLGGMMEIAILKYVQQSEHLLYIDVNFPQCPPAKTLGPMCLPKFFLRVMRPLKKNIVANYLSSQNWTDKNPPLLGVASASHCCSNVIYCYLCLSDHEWLSEIIAGLESGHKFKTSLISKLDYHSYLTNYHSTTIKKRHDGSGSGHVLWLLGNGHVPCTNIFNNILRGLYAMSYFFIMQPGTCKVR
jgi:hypothetical protein